VAEPGFPGTTIVVPALNEEAYLPVVLADIRRELPRSPLIVADNGSTDRTAQIAAGAGAAVVTCPVPGKGAAVKAALTAVRTPRTFLCDADIRGLTAGAVASLHDLKETTGSPAARLSLNRPPDSAPVTTLTALPILAAMNIRGCREPLGGLILADTDWLRSFPLPDGWALDVALTLRAERDGTPIAELPVSGITHRTKPLSEYRQMACEVAAYLVDHVSARTG
jgi:glycosyltransferase involved in cell wall biosynthesis